MFMFHVTTFKARLYVSKLQLRPDRRNMSTLNIFILT